MNFRFWRRTVAFAPAPPPMPVEPVFHTIKTMMMDQFIQLHSSKSYSEVLVSGEASEVDCEQAWSSILSGYYGLVGEGNYKSYLLASGRIDDKKAKIFCVKNAVVYLLKLHDTVQCTSPILLQELEEYGYPVSFDKSNIPKYVKDLERVFTRIKREELQVAQWEKDVTPEDGKDFDPEVYFGEVISAMASLINVQIDVSRTSVWQFCFHLRRLKQACAPKIKK